MTLAGGAALAVASPAQAARDTYIQVVEVRTGYSDTLGGRPPTVGDSFSFTSDLFQKGQKTGTDHGTCTFKKIQGPAENPALAKARCVMVLDFGSGALKLKGPVDFDFRVGPQDFVLKIAKATGRFAGATGAMKHHTASDSTGQLTILLTRA